MTVRKPDPLPWSPGAVADLDALRQSAPCVLVDFRGVRERWGGDRVPSSWGPWTIARSV